MKNVCIIALSFFLSACVGVGFVHDKKRKYNSFDIESIKGEVSEVTTPNIVTMDSIKLAWGEPDKKVQHTNNEEIWFYKRSIDFVGIVPMIGIGIPLVLPTGSNYTAVYFRNNYAVKTEYEYTSWSGFACGLLDEGGINKGCSSLKD